jgi:hypothetical protein
VEVVARRSGPEPDGAEPAPLGAEAALRPEAGRALETGLPCWVIRWREAELGASTEADVCSRLGLRALRRDSAGGVAFSEDEALLGAAGPETSAVVLVVEGWEAPDRALRRFVQALRASAPQRPVFVSVVVAPEKAEQQLELWRDRLRLLADPGVVVERGADAASSAELSS